MKPRENPLQKHVPRHPNHLFRLGLFFSLFLLSACSGDPAKPCATSAGSFIECAGTCIDPQNNREHCGGCENKCPAGSICNKGMCQLSCQKGKDVCGETCVDLQSNRNHCGKCKNACEEGKFCKVGTCQTSCPKEQTECSGKCVDLQSEGAHCGKCGQSCSKGQSCISGTCQCPKDQNLCGDNCVDTLSSKQHCGSCKNTCEGNKLCSSGKCVLTCGDKKKACDGACIDPQSDLKNCGQCGKVCPKGQLCASGKCACPAGFADCSGKCVKTDTSQEHCGQCGKACESGEVCSNGKCQLNCPKNQTKCGNTCVDAQSNKEHCGTCNRKCTGGKTCTSGKCNCPSGQVDCKGVCVDTKTSKAHCGQCGKACGTKEACSNGKCTLTCPTGTKDCGGSCVNTKTNNAHCGACGTKCTGGKTCVSGSCKCPTNKSDCGGICLDLKTSKAHCGGCNKSCKAPSHCSSGKCVLTCNKGQSVCSGSCVDTKTSKDHCGACGTRCTGGKICSSGKCVCSTGQTNCNGVCTNLKNSKTHCGYCGFNCLGSTSCNNGYCRSTNGCSYQWSTCPGGCKNVLFDNDNCGKCGKKCSSSEYCFNGVCGKGKIFNEDPQNVRALAVDAKGNIFIIGEQSKFDDITAFKVKFYGSSDVFIAKLSPQGKFLWLREMGSSGPDYAKDITVDQAGNVYATGYFNGKGTFGTTTLTAQARNIFIVKLDNNGKWIWAKQSNSKTGAKPYHIGVDAQKNVTVVGEYHEDITFGSIQLKSPNEHNIFIAKMDANGKYLWVEIIKSTDNAKLYGFSVAASGNIYITGEFQKSLGFKTKTITTKSIQKTLFLAKFDGKGTFLWAKTPTSLDASRGRDIAVDAKENIYLLGHFSSNLVFGGKTFKGGQSYDLLVCKMDKDGKVLRSFSTKGRGTSWGTYITATPEGKVFFMGTLKGELTYGFQKRVLTSTTQTIMGSMDRDGRIDWLNRVFSETAFGIASDPQGNAYVLGTFINGSNIAKNFVRSKSSWDFFIVKNPR